MLSTPVEPAPSSLADTRIQVTVTVRIVFRRYIAKFIIMLPSLKPSLCIYSVEKLTGECVLYYILGRDLLVNRSNPDVMNKLTNLKPQRGDGFPSLYQSELEPLDLCI